MYTVTVTTKTGRQRIFETEGKPDLTVHPDGSIYNEDANGVAWKINWWECADIQVELAAEAAGM